MPGQPLHRPDPIEVHLRPRPGGGHRRMAILSPPDAAAWDRLAHRMAAILEPRLGPWVVANRSATANGSWRVEGLEEARGRLLGAVARLRRAPILLATDVRDFYPSVRPEGLARSLLAAGAPADVADTAAALLEAWGAYGYPGLPIGPRASGVLANAMLLPADRAVGPAPFVRWVDDFLVGVASEAEACGVLERLDRALEELGLCRSTPKTVLGDRPSGWLAGAARSEIPSRAPAGAAYA